MAGSGPTLDEWRTLYEAAIQVKEIAPWEWMEEIDIFGVQDPETEESGFVSVMGMLGEHLSLAVYLGPEGLYGFWEFQQMGSSAPAEALLEIPHLHASFEDRNELTQKDRDLIKELGLKFRGRQAWPMFRSHRPGFHPWYLEVAEARFLTHTLEQAVEVALRFKEDPALLPASDEDRYLVRMPREDAGALVWEDRVQTVSPPEPRPIAVTMDVDVLEEVSRLPRSRHTLEMDFSIVPARIGERGERPYFPYLLLVVEIRSGLVLGSEFLAPEPDLGEMWGAIPAKLVDRFAEMGFVPRRIKVRSSLLYQLLQPLAEELGFKVASTPILRNLDQVKESFLERF